MKLVIKIILCALNEAQNLTKLLPDINREVKKITDDYQTIICLDGSDDESFALITNLQKSYPIKILELKNQRGLGLAYKRIFLDVIKNSADDDIIISLDADNTHNPSQITGLIQLCKKENLDLAIASRFCRESVTNGFPLHRKFISKATSLVLQTIFPIKKTDGRNLQDYSSGYRAYKAKKLKELFEIKQNNFITEKDFIYTCEILLNIAQINPRINELPLIYDYDKKIGKSKLKIIQNSEGLLKLIMRHFAKKSFTSRK